MIRIKICGITRVDDALAAAAAGADALGLVFVERSKRHVTVEQAQEICRALPPFVARVGLFMDADSTLVDDVLKRVPLNWLQFHGSESPEYCASFSMPWIRAIAMGRGVGEDLGRFSSADALLLDSHAPGSLGGSGQIFDWTSVPDIPRPWILAGGLDPDNVAEACRVLRPDAVDVSTGVEDRPGVKSDKLMTEFIQAVKNG